MTGAKPTRDVVFLDVETNGRYVERGHVAWDVAAWNLTTGHRTQFFTHIPDMSRFLGTAEPVALRVSRFLDRYPLDGPCPGATETRAALDSLRLLFDGGRRMTRAEMLTHPRPIVVGSKPTFDMGFVGPLAVTHRLADPNGDLDPWWHHHPLDLGPYAAGVLGIEPGTSSLSAASVARLCGVEPGDHSAEGDVTSGGRCFLLLREAAREVASGKVVTAAEWIHDATAHGLVEEQIEVELLRRPSAVAS